MAYSLENFIKKLHNIIRQVFACESRLVVKITYSFVQPPTTGGRGMQTPPSKTTGRQDRLF